ncbi:MAG: cell division topological specificity factor MinE [Proteocatella sp.]
MLGFMQAKNKSKDVAKERLKLVLMQDKGRMSSDILSRMKDDILIAIEKYVEVGSANVDVELTKMENEYGELVNALVANIPIRTVK